MPRNRFPLALLITLLAFATSHAQKWDDIPPEDLAASECELDPTAPAEVLFKEIVYDLMSDDSRFIVTRLRTKIYKESALDRARRIKFWYNSHYTPSSVRARVIKPDGSFIEAESDNIVTQIERRSRDRTVRSTTITLPQVEVGDIVEYNYRLNLRRGYYLPEDKVSFQEQWPIRKFALRMKPYVYNGVGFKWASHRTTQGMIRGKDDFYELTLDNQPGYPDEPFQAPDSDARTWFTFYNVSSLANGDRFWLLEGKRLHKQMLSATKNSKIVAEKAAELSQGKRTEQEKLHAFYDFCRAELIHIAHGEADRLTQKQLDDFKHDWDATKTLSNGYGSPQSINTVFCALARAVGIDARLANCADRSEYTFTKVLEQVDIALPNVLVAVKQGESWVFYNPAARYVSFGQLDWIHDDVTALVPDKKELIFAKTQAAAPEQNGGYSQGVFELSPSGDLSGRLVLIAKGNSGITLKQHLDGRSEVEREEAAKYALSRMWPNASMENFAIHNAADPFEPLRIECDLSIPNYAEAVGNRLFLQPNIEERYSNAQFPNSERKTMIFFDHKYRDESHFEIKLPEGYALEAPSAPRPFTVNGLMKYEPHLSVNRTANTLIYKRTLEFEGDRYNPEAYPIIKRSFDMLLAQDHHALTLRKEDATAAAPSETADNS